MSEMDLYDYDLPRELIAQDPLATRSDARLMLINRETGEIDHYHIRDLPEILNPGDTMVMNNSRVVPARLMGYRTNTQGRWQGLFLRADPENGIWEVLTKTRGTLQAGETITVQDRDARDGMQLVVVSRTEGGNLLVKPQLPENYVPLARDGGSGADFDLADPVQWLNRYGRVPLPPYIRDGQMVDADVSHYQTVFAKEPGSVAAPTAGLHFTEPLLGKIRAAGIATGEVTLHVGIGTFRPIQVDQLADHSMHHEWGSIDAGAVELINARRAAGGRCIAVGTTSVRVLESAAANTAGESLATWTGETDLFIRPPYKFAAVDALLTNFHLPRSSLLVLVSAFATRELAMEAYRVAVEQEYRFYSYGDAMLIV
ncbi:MAG: tRNA preQ1(34) S-adenosylmethionine ribosyltransferase-isomerase QueA [Rubripirellula sp.]